VSASPPYRGLGTLLRHLVELLDGDVEQAYRDLGLDYRPRFTPVVRALVEAEPRSIREIANHSGLTHSAVSQTVAEMKRAGLVSLVTDRTDARARLARLTPRCRAMLPKLQQQWAATNSAADGLDAELPASLRATVTEAIAALERKPFRKRIEKCLRRRPA
jgi:MarR family transcriptional regulator, organic hydroperoxide resistance regulator